MAFDLSRLDSTRYNLSDPNQCFSFQQMVKDFMDVVRTNPQFFADKREELIKFCRLIEKNDAWPNASNVVPELRLLQNHDTSQSTALNFILRSVVHKRPAVPTADPSNYHERLLLRRRIQQTIEYLWKEDEGEAPDDLIERAVALMDPNNRQARGPPA